MTFEEWYSQHTGLRVPRPEDVVAKAAWEYLTKQHTQEVAELKSRTTTIIPLNNMEYYP